MNLLALETSGLHGAVACFSDATLLKAVELSKEKRSAQALLPSLERLLDELAWAPQSIDLIAVTVGPGSFTGLRVGVTVAKTLAYAADCQTIGVNTLDAVAHRARNCVGPNDLHAVLDAQRKQFFWADYEQIQNSDGKLAMRRKRDVEIVDQSVWLASLTKSEWVTGPGLKRTDPTSTTANLVAPSDWNPSAVDVGEVALQTYHENGPDDLWTLKPVYYRKSAAEEKLA